MSAELEHDSERELLRRASTALSDCAMGLHAERVTYTGRGQAGNRRASELGARCESARAVALECALASFAAPEAVGPRVAAVRS